MSVVIEVVLRAAADLPEVPAGRVAGASCSPGCRVLDSVQEVADTPLHDPVLQPAYACNKITHRGTSYIIINILCNSSIVLLWHYCQCMYYDMTTLCKGDAPSSSHSIGSALWCSRSLTTSR